MPRRKASGPAFTVAELAPLAVERKGEHWWTEAGGRQLRLSNLDKVFWPHEGYTKGDLLAYYSCVAGAILPYLKDRPLTMKRMPDGAAGPHFYEKQAPSHTPAWIRRCPVEHEEAVERGGITEYLMVDDLASLLFVVNLGCIEFHPLHSSCGSIDEPDYFFFDLDPFEPATFDDVRAVALHVRAAADALGLPTYPKTSGATGMQIYVGIERGPSYEVVREIVSAVARAIRRTDPKRTTLEWEVSKRAGKVFIDANMNRRGANISSVYCVRPEPGATVSTPLTWQEVEDGVHPSEFTIRTLPARLERVGDRFEGVLNRRVDIAPLLSKLGLAQAAAPVEVLTEYRKRRDFDGTPEPAPGPTQGSGDSFVIQKHNATRLHYDLRLERGGVLASWAVPKGLPIATGVRHLAVQTEDHPLEYGGFEGQIPEKNYGAGEVVIFDRGRYEPLEWEDGKITFRLEGQRYRGEYHMVRTSQGWLVMLSKRSAAQQPHPPPAYAPMLAEGGHQPFDDPHWRFEAKLDGVRTLAYVTTDGTRLVSRTGRDHTAQYPELNNLAQYVNALQAVIDGEIVAHDAQGRPSFQRLQQRVNVTSERDIARLRRSTPVTLYAFDVLWYDGEELTTRPLEERRDLLERITTVSPAVRLPLFLDGDGTALFEAAKGLGLEGMIAKRIGSPYTPGRRSKDWRKVKALKTQDCVILGWTTGGGSRSQSLGALLLGAIVDGELVRIGQVGTGFTEDTLAMLLERLAPLERPEPAVDDPELRRLRGSHHVEPVLVCEVEYLAVTDGRRLRAPSFKGLRPDKAPEDCFLERA